MSHSPPRALFSRSIPTGLSSRIAILVCCGLWLGGCAPAGIISTPCGEVLLDCGGQPVVAFAGLDRQVELEPGADTATVTLDGSGSLVAPGESLTFQWTQDGIEISADATVVVTLAAGVHPFDLRATDSEGLADTDRVTITVAAATPATGLCGAVGLPTLGLTLMGLGWLRSSRCAVRSGRPR